MVGPAPVVVRVRPPWVCLEGGREVGEGLLVPLEIEIGAAPVVGSVGVGGICVEDLGEKR